MHSSLVNKKMRVWIFVVAWVCEYQHSPPINPHISILHSVITLHHQYLLFNYKLLFHLFQYHLQVPFPSQQLLNNNTSSFLKTPWLKFRNTVHMIILPLTILVVVSVYRKSKITNLSTLSLQTVPNQFSEVVNVICSTVSVSVRERVMCYGINRQASRCLEMIFRFVIRSGRGWWLYKIRHSACTWLLSRHSVQVFEL